VPDPPCGGSGAHRAPQKPAQGGGSCARRRASAYARGSISFGRRDGLGPVVREGDPPILAARQEATDSIWSDGMHRVPKSAVRDTPVLRFDDDLCEISAPKQACRLVAVILGHSKATQADQNGSHVLVLAEQS
jgi:hypothetical protein